MKLLIFSAVLFYAVYSQHAFSYEGQPSIFITQTSIDRMTTGVLANIDMDEITEVKTKIKNAKKFTASPNARKRFQIKMGEMKYYFKDLHIINANTLSERHTLTYSGHGISFSLIFYTENPITLTLQGSSPNKFDKKNFKYSGEIIHKFKR